MSFKIPSALEPLGFEPLSGVDLLEKGDLIVIPDLASEPRLRVSIETLRKWGLSVKSTDDSGRHGCANYSTAKGLFGNDSWGGFCPQDAKSHVLVVESASHDKNSVYGKDAEPTLEFVNANSLTGCETRVRAPVLPLMSLRAAPMDPLYPANRSGNDYPSTLGHESDRTAYDMLMASVGDASIPTAKHIARIRSDGFANLPFFIAVLSTLFSESGEYASTLGKEKIEELYVGYCGYDRRPLRASGFVMTAPAVADKERSEHCNAYFHRDSYAAERRSLSMTRKFADAIVRHGALLYRSKGLAETASRIMAHEVAANMAGRYAKVIAKLERLMEGLGNEMPKIREIGRKFSEASDALAVPDDVVRAIRKLF